MTITIALIMTSCRISTGIPAEFQLSLDDQFVFVNGNNDSNVMISCRISTVIPAEFHCHWMTSLFL